MGIKTWSELNATDPESSHCMSRIVNNFQSRQCVMSRVVTNRGRQRFRVAVNGESLSDDLKKKARVGTQESVKKTAREGTQEPVKQEHSQQQAKEQCQQQAKT